MIKHTNTHLCMEVDFSLLSRFICITSKNSNSQHALTFKVQHLEVDPDVQYLHKRQMYDSKGGLTAIHLSLIV